jgi:hypothetical protein
VRLKGSWKRSVINIVIWGRMKIKGKGTGSFRYWALVRKKWRKKNVEIILRKS